MENNNNSIYSLTNLTRNIHIAAYYEHYYLAFDMQFHSHAKIEIMYVTLGELIIQYYDKNEELHSFKIRSNEFVFIDADIKHKIMVENKNTRIYNIEMFLGNDNNAALLNIYDTYKPFRDMIKNAIPVFKEEDDGLVIQNIILIQKYFESRKINDEADEKTTNMIGLLFMCIADCMKNEKSYSYGSNKVNQAIEYIQTNYANDISLNDLATACNISKNHLNNLFKVTFQKTVMAYLNNYRIKEACQLIVKTNLSLEQVRARVGFSNKMSFNRNFEKTMMMTPSKYRQSIIKKSHLVVVSTGIVNNYN